MFKRTLIASGIAMMLGQSLPAIAADSAELQQIRKEIKQIKESYEARIQALEARLQQAEDAAREAQASAARADEKATQVATAPQPSIMPGANAFNPEVSLILSGLYTNLSRDPANYRITGFIPGGEIGPGSRGFSLAESELGLRANIDPHFYGGLSFAMAPDDTVSVEEAFIQSIGLSHGLTLKAGRFFSGIGYLNEKHAHVWDFVDAPLAYQAFLGGQLGDDGIQLKWLAPTDTFLEVGMEVERGKNFPGADRDKNGTGAGAVFAHVGGDAGTGGSWRAGLSYLATSPRERAYDDIDLAGVGVTNSFSGTSKLWLADLVWKWAPDGNPARTGFTLQGEYFRRKENGSLTYDTASPPASLGPQTDSYFSSQSGWYLQGIYQFLPRWRVGLRRDQLDAGNSDYASNNANLEQSSYNPSKASLMVDYSPSEYSRVRLQVAQDKSRQDATDNQLFLQYQMSLGAHGAHKF